MINKESRLHYLLTRYTANECTREELLELLIMIGGEERAEQLDELVAKIGEQISAEDKMPELDKEQIFANIISAQPEFSTHAEPGAKSEQKKFAVYNWLGYAAAFVLATLTITYFTLQNPAAEKVQTAQVVKSTIAPGGNKAVLTLADGSRIALNDDRVGTVATENQIPVKQLPGGIAYQPNAAVTVSGSSSSSSSSSLSSSSLAFNKLTTPVGGQYSIVLIDGTKVWLNAMSALKYPVTFAGNERKVELIGEGYFEVAPDKKSPFIVLVNNTEVKVYGTHFNIMAYAEEKNTKLTLLEGSVKVTNGGASKMMIPGQQALVTNGSVVLQPAHGAEAIAWKEGKFNFAHERIEDIMRKLSRWFDIEVNYQGNITKEGFVGTLPRSKTLAEVLNTLSLTGLVQFKVEGRSVTVMP